MKRFLPLLIALFSLAGCNWFQPDIKDRQVVLVYFAGNNSLAQEGRGDYEDLFNSWLPPVKDKEKILLVYRHFTEETPVLCRLSRDRHGNTVEDVIMEYPYTTNSATAATLSTVIADAEAAWPAGHHGLILWSHATGFLPEGYYSHPKDQAGSGASLMSFGEDNGSEIEITDLRKALSVHMFDFIVFDCCLMANVEVAYELRNCCDYILFSPTEILSDGFPYEKMIQPIFSSGTEEAMRNIGMSYIEYYKAQSGVYQSATISLVKCAEMDYLAAACAPVFRSHQDQIMVLDRSRIQRYSRYDRQFWYYDIDDFVGRIATDSEYRKFISALDRAVIFKDATDKFLSIDILHYSGLSIYIPRPEYTILNNFYKTLQWNSATGLVM